LWVNATQYLLLSIIESEAQTVLTQLLYVSASDIVPDAPNLEDVIANILSTSYVNNQRDGVTGLLLYSGGYFCQLLEGEDRAVDTLYAKITQDTRHRDLNLLFKRPTDWAFIPRFPMGCAGIEREPDELIVDAVNLRGWTTVSEAAPVVLYALLNRVPQTDLVMQDPNQLLSTSLKI
jgi:hypothetical protein